MQPSYFQPLSFQQASPMVSGMEAGSNIAANNSMNMLRNMQAAQTGIQNAYLPSSLAQKLQSQKLANALAQSKLPFAAPQAQANLDLTGAQTGLVQGQASAIPSQIALQQAQTGLVGAQTGLAGANTGLVNAQTQIMPFNALGKVDPVSQLLYSHMLLQRMFGGNGAPPITSNNGGMTIQSTAPQMGSMQNATSLPNGIPYSPQAMAKQQPQQVPNTNASVSQYPTLPGGSPLSAGLAGAKAAAIPTITGSGMGALNSIQPGSSLADNLYQTSLNNMVMGMGKNPTMGSNRAGAGGTFVNPITGQQYSTDTNKNTTMDQQSVGAISRVNELIPQIYNDLAPFQTASGKAALYSQKAGNFFMGHDNPLPSQEAAGDAKVKLAAESLLRGYGLNVTDQSTKFMMDSVEPKLGESQQAYKTRMNNLQNLLGQNSQQASARLQGGIPLNQSGQQSQQSSGTPQTQGTSIPSFTSKAEFQEWYKQQPPQAQATIRQQLGNA